MQRYGSGAYHQAISHVLGNLARGHRRLIEHAEFLCDVSPIFAGLHSDRWTQSGRSYADTAHCCWPRHLRHLPRNRQRTTVVLPTLRAANFWTVYHELGHVFQHSIDYWDDVVPITDYAKTNNFEAFAEAFCAWRWPLYANKDLRVVDPKTDALFELLA